MTIQFEDDFTVGEDFTALSTYDSGYVQIDGGANGMRVQAVDDYAEAGGASNADIAYVLTQPGVPSGGADQKITADTQAGSGYTGGEVGVMGSDAAGGGDYYIMTINGTTAELFRVVNGSFTALESRTVNTLTNGSFYSAYMQAVINGAQVDITYGHAQGVGVPWTYSDTSANRLTTGGPVIGCYGNASGGNNGVDNVVVDDLISGGSVSNSKLAVFESRKLIKIPLITIFEARRALSATVAKSFESLKNTETSKSASTESQSAANAGGLVRFEGLATLLNQSAGGIESRGDASQNTGVNFESLFSLGIQKNIAIESMALMGNDGGAIYEGLQGAAQSTVSRFESLSALAIVSQQQTAMIESLAIISKSNPAGYCVLSGLVRARGGHFESVASLVIDRPAALEWQTGVVGIDGAAYESLISLLNSESVQIEALGLGVVPTYEDLELVLSGELNIEMLLFYAVNIH